MYIVTKYTCKTNFTHAHNIVRLSCADFHEIHKSLTALMADSLYRILHHLKRHEALSK